MPVTVTTLNRSMNFRMAAETMDALAEIIAIVLRPSDGPVLSVEMCAQTLTDLLDAIPALARQLDDPDRIVAIRVDEDACCAELDVAARPGDPRRLH